MYDLKSNIEDLRLFVIFATLLNNFTIQTRKLISLSFALMFGLVQLLQVLHTHHLPQVNRSNATELSNARAALNCTICDYCFEHTGEHKYQQFPVLFRKDILIHYVAPYSATVNRDILAASNRGPPALS